MNALKLRYHGTICLFLEWIGKDETGMYRHHLKRFAKEALKMGGSA